MFASLPVSGPVRINNCLLDTVRSVYISKTGANHLVRKKCTISSKHSMSLSKKKIVIFKKYLKSSKHIEIFHFTMAI